MNKKKIVLAFSGGLDTSVIIPWLKEKYQKEIIAVCVDVGQSKEDKKDLRTKALKLGAKKFFLIDAREEFIKDYIFPTMQAGAIYENKYLLGTAMSRPLIAKKLIEIAKQEQAYAICHGATAKGNDQVRFELTIKAFAPEIEIIAPWREWSLKSRQDELDFLKARKIAFTNKTGKVYSEDQNLWHISHEGEDLENTNNEPDYDNLLTFSLSPEKAPNHPTILEITFVNGLPTSLNGKKLNPLNLLEQLNKLGGQNGIGIVDLIEDRVVGMKSRGIYETPGGQILYFAYQELEHLCLDKQTQAFKNLVANKFAELVYNGLWFSPLRQALSAFVQKLQPVLTGTVKLKLYKGNIIRIGIKSDYSLYNANLASFTVGDLYSNDDAKGFINLFGLPLKVNALIKARKTKK